MAKTSFFQRQLDRIAKASTTNMGDVLIFTSVAGWIASSAAQIVGIGLNKNYTKEQKKFMLPQECADAFINIGSFFIVTKSLKSLSSKLVSSGKLAPKKIVEFLESKQLSHKRGDFDFDISQLKMPKDIKSTYNGFKCFADSTAAVIGGVLSSNIITPILRNNYASHRQNTYLAKNKKDEKPIVISTPRHTFNDFRKTVLSI